MEHRTKPAWRMPAVTGLALALILLLAACGGGSGESFDDTVIGGSALAEGLILDAKLLPGAQRGVDYGPVRLRVENASADDLVWRVWQGDLPDGLSLDSDGTLSGTPRHRGVSVFSVHVSDGERAGVATRAVAVDAFGLYARSGLSRGEAWSGRAVGLATAGAEGFVQFAALYSASGGRFHHVDGAAGEAYWIPGSTGGSLAEDTLEARDTATGRTHVVTLRVRPDPTEVHAAEFGTTDVWYVSTTRKFGDHAYASDFHKGLAVAGLRGRGHASLDAVGRCVDLLAAQYVRLELMRALDRFYLRDRGPSEALPVSFPYYEPGAGYAKPPEGRWARGGAGRYNELSVLDGRGSRLLGTAYIDGADNALIENDTSDGDQALGVFIDVLVPYFRFYNRSSLTSLPLEEADEDALHALLHDLPNPGGRFIVIRRQCVAFARALAIVIAHEIGHSLGLEHTEPAGANSLMNPAALIEPWSHPRLSDDDLARLRARLPGSGRGDIPGAEGKPALPQGGVATCAGGTCHLHPPQVLDLRQLLRETASALRR